MRTESPRGPGALIAVGVAAVAVAMAIASCGVSPDEARVIVAEGSSASATPGVDRPGATAPRIYLVRGDTLVPVRRALPARPDVSAVLDALSAPVTPDEEARGLRSVLAGADTDTDQALVLPAGAGAGPTGVATVVATDALRALPPSQQVLAIGQLTSSLAAAGFAATVFVDAEGSRLAVPGPEGRLLDRPVTAEDYAPLRAGRPSAAG